MNLILLRWVAILESRWIEFIMKTCVYITNKILLLCQLVWMFLNKLDATLINAISAWSSKVRFVSAPVWTETKLLLKERKKRLFNLFIYCSFIARTKSFSGLFKLTSCRWVWWLLKTRLAAWVTATLVIPRRSMEIYDSHLQFQLWHLEFTVHCFFFSVKSVHIQAVL